MNPDSQSLRHTLREAVFGTQDGLISTLGALTGIAEGTRSAEAVVIAGCVIIVVESLSMASGSYLSSKSQSEYLQHLLKEEQEQIEKNPEGERQEIREMYRSRGYTDSEIAVIENRLLSDKELLLEDMAHKELGIVPEAMEQPATNAFIMGTCYVIGGIIPVLPYFCVPIESAMPISVIGTLSALFVFGAIKGRMVRQAWWRSGLEMLFIAGLASLAGYLIGRWVSAWVA